MQKTARSYLHSSGPNTGIWLTDRQTDIQTDGHNGSGYYSSGITRVGVTRSGNWQCHPYFLLKKTGDLFSHHRLSAVSSAVSPLFIFSWKKWRPFFGHHCRFYSFHSGVTHWRMSPWAVPLVTPQYYSGLHCEQFGRAVKLRSWDSGAITQNLLCT